MSNIKEAIKEIDEMIGHMIGPYGEEPECSTLRSIKNKLLESVPEPGEFTKDKRGWFDTVLKYGPASQLQIETIISNAGLLGIEIRFTEARLAAKEGLEACARIDRLEAVLKDKHTISEEDANHYKKLCVEVLDLQTENKHLNKQLMRHGEALAVLSRLRHLYNLSPNMRDPRIESVAKGLMKSAEEGLRIAHLREQREYIDRLHAALKAKDERIEELEGKKP